MKKLAITFGTILLVVGCFAFFPASQAQSRSPAPTIVTFNVPGAGTGPFQGTLVTAVNAAGARSTFSSNINPAGTIAGDFTDANDVHHGFVRAFDGTFTTFDAPGA